MDQDNRDHEIRAPAVQGSNEPTKRDAVIESLKAVPRLSGRRHIDQRKQYAGYNLQHKTREPGTAENIKPAHGRSPKLMLGSFPNPPALLHPDTAPAAHLYNTTHSL